MICKFFESQIEEGFKNNICLICRKPNCKHLQSYRIRQQKGIINFIISIMRKDEEYYPTCKKWAFGRRVKTIPQLKKLFKSQQKSMEEKEFWLDNLTKIPYNELEITNIPYKHKYRPSKWTSLDSKGIVNEGFVIEVKNIPWKRIVGGMI